MASTSPSSTRLPLSWPSESNNNSSSTSSLRDVSFSSYLNSSEESYIRSLVESTQNLNHGHHHHNSRQTKKAEEEEIGVFSADKYFNGGAVEEEVDLKNTRRRSTNARKHCYDQYRNDHVIQEVIPGDDDHHSMSMLNKAQPRTPSSYSESSSSWNSQSALLRRIQRVPSRSSNNNNNNDDNSNNKSQGKSSFLSCCSCYDKSAVDIEDDLITSTTHGRRGYTTKSIDADTQPFVFPQVPLSETGVKKKMIHEEDDERRKKSLDVFGSSDMDDHMTLGRRLNMSSWDAIPRRHEQPPPSAEEFTSPASGPPDSTESYKDSESDTSSDLFEIECLAPKTTCYAPSEVSIEWSVVTASAADFSTVSDSEDHQKSGSTTHRRTNSTPKTNHTSKMSGMLLGCKSQKAVRVAGEAYRKPGGGREKLERERRQRYSADSFTAMTRFQAEAKLGRFGAQKQQIRKEPSVNVIAPRSPRWSHSSHASELLYIQ